MPTRVAKWCVFLLLCTVGMPVLGVVHLYDSQQTQSMTDSFSIYHERRHVMSVNEVMAKRHEFVFQSDINPNYGFSEHGLWLHAEIANLSQITEWAFSLNFSQLDKVDFYVVINDQVVKQSHQGKLQPDQHYRNPVFSTTLPLNVDAELFVRVESNSSALIVPIYVTSQDNQTSISQIDNLLWGFFYGGLMILAIYNFVLYTGSNEQSLIGYVIYIVAVFVWQFVWGGHLHLFFPNTLSPILSDHTPLIFVMIGICSGLFSVIFLETKENASSTHPFVVAFLWLQGSMGLISLLSLLPPAWENNLVYGVSMLSICSYITAGFEAYFNKYKPARYFIFAWGILAAGALVGMLSLIGIVPSNVYTSYCFQVAVFLESALFSIALLDKSRNRVETDVSAATDELRHNMELIEEQNVRLDIARKDAIKASNVKSQFLANMSHEIRTPLNAILGFSKELTNLSLSADKMEQVRIINTAADNLLTIVNDVLDFSKIEAGKLNINNQPFSPNSLFEEMVTIMSKSAHMKGLEFIFELAPLPEKLIGDVFRIRQVLNNLLSNAIKFTSSGYIKLSVRGRAMAHGIHELEIKIEDTGIGISRKDRNKLFSAFSQLDDSLNRSYQGTGLGLVICQELIKLMRGTLTLQSTPGQGSLFIVTIRTNQLSQRFSLTTHSEWQNKRVVLFDPHPESRRASAMMLCSLGARVLSAESLDYLSQQTTPIDYLFASLPVSRHVKWEPMLEVLVTVPAEKRVLWFSGDEPLAEFTAYLDDFEAQVRLPLTPTKLDGLLHGDHLVQRSPLQTQASTLPSAQILAVDDMDMNLKLLDTWLSGSAVQVTLSTSGQDAVKQCEKQDFDLILMDVQMPGMDGLQASRHIRKTPLNQGTPIIAVTAHAFKEEQERLLSAGMDDYLPKPIEYTALINLIKRWCQNKDDTAMALPSLDWQLSVKRANHNRDTALELLHDFIKQLPQSIEAIQIEWSARNFKGVQDQIHRLHGACCYTGVPKLQALANSIESNLKLEKHVEISEQIPAFILECEIVIAQANKFIQEYPR